MKQNNTPAPESFKRGELCTALVASMAEKMWVAAQDKGFTSVLDFGQTRIEFNWCDRHSTFEFLFRVDGETIGFAPIADYETFVVHLSAVIYVDEMIFALAEKDKATNDALRSIIGRLMRNDLN